MVIGVQGVGIFGFGVLGFGIRVATRKATRRVAIWDLGD